jgi:hypothetical protein
MSVEHTFTLPQVDQTRTDFVAIESEMEIIQAQVARLPMRRELAQTALLATLTGAAILPAADPMRFSICNGRQSMPRGLWPHGSGRRAQGGPA